MESWSLWSHWFFSWGCKCVLVVYFWDRMKISGWQGLAGEGWGMNWWSTEDFLGQWQYSGWCYTNGYIICHLTFVLTHKCTTPGVNPKVNHGLWVISMCQYRFINCNKCTTVVGDADNGRGYVWAGAGGQWGIAAPSPFSMKLTILKNKVN